MASSEALLPVTSRQDPLSESRSDTIPETRRRRAIKVHLAIYSGLLLIALYVALIVKHDGSTVENGANKTTTESRVHLAGVSEKSNEERLWRFSDDRTKEAFPWNNSMLSWQRTAFHFQPEKNWMNGMNKR